MDICKSFAIIFHFLLASLCRGENFKHSNKCHINLYISLYMYLHCFSKKCKGVLECIVNLVTVSRLLSLWLSKRESKLIYERCLIAYRVTFQFSYQRYLYIIPGIPDASEIDDELTQKHGFTYSSVLSDDQLVNSGEVSKNI